MKGYVKIDLSEVIQEFAISEKQTKNLCKTVLNAVSEEIANNWRKLAGNSLKSTRAGYIRGIVVVEEGRLTNAIILRGSLNNMLESGNPAYDMKNYFMNSKKVKHNKHGQWYLHIPFRMATPGALGENEAFSSVMPTEVYNVAKDLKAQKTTMAGTRLQKAKGMTKDQIPKAYRDVITKKNREGFSDYTHKHSIYEGVFRTEKIKSGGQKESNYTSIRTASANSDPSSWIHPGFAALNLAEKAQSSTDIDVLVNNATDKFLASL